MQGVKSEIEARAQVRSEQEKAEYEGKLRERAAKEKVRGRKLGGKQPQAPEAGPKAKDQVNFTLLRIAHNADFSRRVRASL